MNAKPSHKFSTGARLLLLVALLLFYGCTSQNTSPLVAVRNVTVDFDGIPLSAECAQWEDGCALILITSIDGPSMRGADWRPTLALWLGELSSHDGRKVNWDCQSSDGSTGKIMVDNVTYDLAKGSLMLVRLKEDSVIAKQFDRETLTMAPGTQTIESLLEDAEVAEFFQDAATPKP